MSGPERWCPQCHRSYVEAVCEHCRSVAQCADCALPTEPEPIGDGPRDAGMLARATCPHTVPMGTCGDVWCRSRMDDAMPSLRAVTLPEYWQRRRARWVEQGHHRSVAGDMAWRDLDRKYHAGRIQERDGGLVVEVDDAARPGHLLMCEVCDGPFRARRRDARFCSPKCRTAHGRAAPLAS